MTFTSTCTSPLSSTQRVLWKAISNQNAPYNLFPLFLVSCLKMPMDASGKRVLRHKAVERYPQSGKLSLPISSQSKRNATFLCNPSVFKYLSIYFQSMYTSPRSPNMLSLGFGSCWPLMTWEKENKTGMFRLNKYASVYTVYWSITSVTVTHHDSAHFPFDSRDLFSCHGIKLWFNYVYTKKLFEEELR